MICKIGNFALKIKSAGTALFDDEQEEAGKSPAEAMRRGYASYSESETSPHYMKKEHIKKVLAEMPLRIFNIRKKKWDYIY